MPGFEYDFNAQNFQPSQGVPTHPPGKFQATITGTEVVPTKDNSGGRFVITWQTQAGVISKGYNLWNQSHQAVEIAQKELSALCHAVGIFQVSMRDEGAALRNAQHWIEVGPQRKNPEYTEVVRVYDRNGHEPGKANAGPAPAPQQQPPAPAPAPQSQPQPAAWGGPQQGGGPIPGQPPGAPAWGGPGQGAAPQQQPNPPAPGGWGGAPQQQPQQGAPGGWQQNNAGPGPAPWGNR